MIKVQEHIYHCTECGKKRSSIEHKRVKNPQIAAMCAKEYLIEICSRERKPCKFICQSLGFVGEESP